jgi:hypothetical protein
MMPDTTARTLRQVAEVLRGIHLWDDAVELELATTSRRLDLLADCVEEKVIDFPTPIRFTPKVHLVHGIE